jgi:hypothetical protein
VTTNDTPQGGQAQPGRPGGREAIRRQAVRTSLERRFGRAVPVTDAMIDAVLAELDGGQVEAGR